MKPPYDVHFLILIQIIHQKDKVYYFSNKNVIFVMMANWGKSVDWVDIMFKHLHKELVKWTKT
jgi:hypothetical protein